MITKVRSKKDEFDIIKQRLIKPSVFSSSKDIIIICIIFVISPTFGVLSAFLYAILTDKEKMGNYLIWILSLYTICVLSTRTYPAMGYGTDIDNNYQFSYYWAKEKTLIRYIISTHEYGFKIIVWLGYHIFRKSYSLFILCIQSCIYILTYLSIYKFWKYHNHPVSVLAAMLAFISFMVPFLGITNNLLSQQLATSIMIYAIINKVLYGKTNWFLVVLSISCHAMTLFFVPFFFFNQLKQRFNKKQLMTILLAIIVLQYVFTHLTIFESVDIYAANRLSTAEDYSGHDIINPAVVITFLVAVVLTYVKNVLLGKWCSPELIYMHNFMLILITAVALMINMPLVQTRFYIVRLFILPFVFAYVFMPRTNIAKIYHFVIFIAFFIWFHLYSNQYYDIPNNVISAKTIWDFIILFKL